jgi:hypothetical protein
VLEAEMTESAAKVDFKKAMLDPAGTFAEPMDIVAHQELTRSQKLRLLEQWEREARSLAVAEEEGMTGGEESMLSRVRHAISALGAEAGERTGGSTKHG